MTQFPAPAINNGVIVELKHGALDGHRNLIPHQPDHRRRLLRGRRAYGGWEGRPLRFRELIQESFR